MPHQDYYRTLGVDPHADAKTIKNAYRELAFKYHPDRNETDPTSAEHMKQVNEAYAVLSNPKRRSEYDALRGRFGESAYGQFRSTYSEQDIFKGSDVHQIFEEMARSFGLRGVDSIFSDFYGPGYKRFEFRRHGLHGKGFVYRGGFGNRRGTAEAGGPLPGMGRFVRSLLQKAVGLNLPQNGEDIHDTIYLTPDIAGSGGPFAYLHRQLAKKLVITIPAGTRQGQQIRLTGMGVPGKHGGSAGDLYLKVKLKKSLVTRAKDFIVSTFHR